MKWLPWHFKHFGEAIVASRKIFLKLHYVGHVYHTITTSLGLLKQLYWFNFPHGLSVWLSKFPRGMKEWKTQLAWQQKDLTKVR